MASEVYQGRMSHLVLHSNGKLPPGEAATIAEFNRKTVQLMSSELLKGYLPPQWLHMTKVKALYYEGLSDYFTAKEQLTEVIPGTRNETTASWSGRCLPACLLACLPASLLACLHSSAWDHACPSRSSTLPASGRPLQRGSSLASRPPATRTRAARAGASTVAASATGLGCARAGHSVPTCGVNGRVACHAISQEQACRGVPTML